MQLLEFMVSNMNLYYIMKSKNLDEFTLWRHKNVNKWGFLWPNYLANLFFSLYF